MEVLENYKYIKKNYINGLGGKLCNKGKLPLMSLNNVIFWLSFIVRSIS
jgi:hypothetical protein